MQLAPPGAGIPRPERMYGWVLVRAAAMLPVSKLLSKFERASAMLVDLCPAGGLGTRPVLVPRVTGIEDSSRNWSGAMVLEHLTIVGRLAVPLIRDLSCKRVSTLLLRTQDVKPAGDQTRERSVSDFQAMVRGYTAAVREMGRDVLSPARHQHPWFGKLRCRQWVAFMTLHHMVHVGHMKAIRAAIESGAPLP